MMISDGSKLNFHDNLKTQHFAWSCRIWADVGLRIARGSSLARISLPCGVALFVFLCFVSLLCLHGAKHSSSGGPLRQSRGVEASLFVNYLWSTVSLASSHDSGRGGAEPVWFSKGILVVLVVSCGDFTFDGRYGTFWSLFTTWNTCNVI